MLNSLKDKQLQKSKLSKNIVNLSPNNPSFSFCYLTTSKKYNFSNLDKGKQKEWSTALVKRMIEISKESWNYWLSLRKEQGLETLAYEKINFSPNGIDISQEAKMFIFRFNSQKGRIIGFKVGTIFYVIGFDFDYSAYDHGA